MEIFSLRYFLAVAREANMTRAAETLHVSQPALSKAIKYLEVELGTTLFKRTNYGIRLTEEGLILRKRAEDILSMVDKTSSEFKTMHELLGGELTLACAESYLMKYIALAIKRMREKYPYAKFHIKSGNTEQTTEILDKGLADFGYIADSPNLSKFNIIEMPGQDTWGILLSVDSPLANKENITFEDLKDIPLICSEQSFENDYSRWIGESVEKLNIVGTYTLAYNASVFVQSGLGGALIFDKIISSSIDNGLCFRPLFPTLTTRSYIIWKKHQKFNPAAVYFLECIQEIIKTSEV